MGKRRSSYISPDWFHNHSELKKLMPLGEPSYHGSQLLSFLWPAATDYNSPLNPIFLFGISDLRVLNTRSVWMVRDGLVPLLWFFKVCPKPGPFAGRILVADEFSAYVPTAWRPQVGTYKIISTRGLLSEDPTKLLVSGILNERSCSLDFVDQVLDQLIQNIGIEKLTKMEKVCFFTNPHSPFGGEKKCEFFVQLTLKIFQKLGTENTRILGWSEVEALRSLENYYYCDLNEMNLIADNYLLHSALRNGAKILKKEPKESGRTFVQLSSFHGISFRDSVKGEYMLEPRMKSVAAAMSFYRRFENAMKSEANLSLPWPTLFMKWNEIQATQNGGSELLSKVRSPQN